MALVSILLLKPDRYLPVCTWLLSSTPFASSLQFLLVVISKTVVHIFLSPLSPSYVSAALTTGNGLWASAHVPSSVLLFASPVAFLKFDPLTPWLKIHWYGSVLPPSSTVPTIPLALILRLYRLLWVFGTGHISLIIGASTCAIRLPTMFFCTQGPTPTSSPRLSPTDLSDLTLNVTSSWKPL